MTRSRRPQILPAGVIDPAVRVSNLPRPIAFSGGPRASTLPKVIAFSSTSKTPSQVARKRRANQRRRQRGAGGGAAPSQGSEVPRPIGIAGGGLSPMEVIMGRIQPRVRTRNNALRRVVRRTSDMDATTMIMWDFVEKHLDPCGEFDVLTANARIPDGAVPNSFPMELREADNIRPPTITSVDPLPLTGSMWTLTLIQTNALRTPLILIAAMNNQVATPATMGLLFDDFNTMDDPNLSRYPNWTRVESAPDYYFCWYGWSALDNVAEPGPNGSTTAISRWRMCGDGLTVGFNTPTLVDQGWAMCAQVAPDQQHENVTQILNDDSELETVKSITMALNPQRMISDSIFGANSVAFPAEVGDTVFTDPTTATVSARVFRTLGNHNLIMTLAVGDQFRVSLQRLPDNTNGTANYQGFYQTSTDGGVTWTNTDISFTFLANTTNAVYTFTWIHPPKSGDDARSVNRVKIQDNITSGALYQATPQAYMCTLKESLGLYTVKRIWNPVLNFTDASTFAPLKFFNSFTSELNAKSIGGKSDTLDQNFGMTYINFSGISTSAQPIIKMRRVIELIADTGSPYVPVMIKGVSRIEEALVIVKKFAEMHPHAYPISYNGFGKLFDIIGGVLSQIPIIGNSIKPLVSILQNILSGGGSNGVGSKNVVGELNGETLELLMSLLQSIGLDGGGSSI